MHFLVCFFSKIDTWHHSMLQYMTSEHWCSWETPTSGRFPEAFLMLSCSSGIYLLSTLRVNVTRIQGYNVVKQKCYMLYKLYGLLWCVVCNAPTLYKHFTALKNCTCAISLYFFICWPWRPRAMVSVFICLWQPFVVRENNCDIQLQYANFFFFLWLAPFI